MFKWYLNGPWTLPPSGPFPPSSAHTFNVAHTFKWSSRGHHAARNIERNNARLFELGLMSAFEVKVSNLKARGAREVPAEEEEDSASGSEYGRWDEQRDEW